MQWQWKRTFREQFFLALRILFLVQWIAFSLLHQDNRSRLGYFSKAQIQEVDDECQAWTFWLLDLCKITSLLSVTHHWKFFNIFCSLVLCLQNCNSLTFCFTLAVSLTCSEGRSFMVRALPCCIFTKVLHCSFDSPCYEREELQLWEAMIQRYK